LPPPWTETTYYYLLYNQPLPMDGYYFPPKQNKLLWEMSEWIHKKGVNTISNPKCHVFSLDEQF
jgi:hypothetical protein